MHMLYSIGSLQKHQSTSMEKGVFLTNGARITRYSYKKNKSQSLYYTYQKLIQDDS